jgi:hypothetical protein
MMFMTWTSSRYHGEGLSLSLEFAIVLAFANQSLGLNLLLSTTCSHGNLALALDSVLSNFTHASHALLLFILTKNVFVFDVYYSL